MLNNERSFNIKAIGRAISIIKCFSSLSPELSLAEISKLTKLPKSTVHRILQTLSQGGFIGREEKNGNYRLGIEFIRLGFIAKDHIDIRQVALPTMKWLSQIAEQTSNLYVIHDNQRVCIEQAIGPNYIRRHSFLGATFPLYTSASGRVLLSYMPEDWREEYFRTTIMIQSTENTIVERAELEKLMENVRKQGYAVSRGERDKFSASVAAPIFDHEGQMIACVTVSGALEMFSDTQVQRMVPLLLQASDEISRKMGFQK